MPGAEFPTSAKGWLTVFVSSFIGFLAGFVAIKLMRAWLGE